MSDKVTSKLKPKPLKRIIRTQPEEIEEIPLVFEGSQDWPQLVGLGRVLDSAALSPSADRDEEGLCRVTVGTIRNGALGHIGDTTELEERHYAFFCLNPKEIWDGSFFKSGLHQIT